MITLYGKRFLSVIALGLNPQSTIHECLLCEPVDWMPMLEEADKQTMIGVFYGGIKELSKHQTVSISNLLQIHSHTTFVVDANKKMNEVLERLFDDFNGVGLNVFLLKGQGIGQYYPEPNYRQSGDIDLFAPLETNRLNGFLTKYNNATCHETTVLHNSFELEGIEIESHHLLTEFYSRKYRNAWNRIFDQLIQFDCSNFRNAKTFPHQLNLLYIFIHFLHHLMREGVGLRQLCDWLVLLKVKHAEIDKVLFLKHAEELGLTRAMTSACYIGAEYLGFDCKIMPFDIGTQQAQEDGDFMLKDILTQGNFGHESGLYERGSLSKSAAAYWGRMKRLWKFRRFQPLEALSFPFSRINYWLSK